MIGRAGRVVVVGLGLLGVAAAAPEKDQKAPPARAALVITEVMYDPVSGENDDQHTEWVEIQNVGARSVSLQGLQLTSGTANKPHDARQRYVLGDVNVPPGGFVVIGVGSAESYAGFGLPPFAAHCGESKYAWFTNAGDSVALRDADDNVIDEVVYSARAPWPAANRNGGSIQFIPPAGADPAKANDDPKNWVASVAGNSDEFDKHGRGTPGRATPEDEAAKKKPAATTRPTRKR